jgi:hypothetical protein
VVAKLPSWLTKCLGGSWAIWSVGIPVLAAFSSPGDAKGISFLHKIHKIHKIHFSACFQGFSAGRGLYTKSHKITQNSENPRTKTQNSKTETPDSKSELEIRNPKRKAVSHGSTLISTDKRIPGSCQGGRSLESGRSAAGTSDKEVKIAGALWTHPIHSRTYAASLRQARWQESIRTARACGSKSRPHKGFGEKKNLWVTSDLETPLVVPLFSLYAMLAANEETA